MTATIVILPKRFAALLRGEIAPMPREIPVFEAMMEEARRDFEYEEYLREMDAEGRYVAGESLHDLYESYRDDESAFYGAPWVN